MNMRTRRRSPLWVLILAGAILALTAMAGPDLIQHLGGSAKEAHACAISHWTHGAGAGALSCSSLLAPTLMAGNASPDSPSSAREISVEHASPRAPPSLA